MGALTRPSPASITQYVVSSIIQESLAGSSWNRLGLTKYLETHGFYLGISIIIAPNSTLERLHLQYSNDWLISSFPETQFQRPRRYSEMIMHFVEQLFSRLTGRKGNIELCHEYGGRNPEFH